jgi:hypothetical protein
MLINWLLRVLFCVDMRRNGGRFFSGEDMLWAFPIWVDIQSLNFEMLSRAEFGDLRRNHA